MPPLRPVFCFVVVYVYVVSLAAQKEKFLRFMVLRFKVLYLKLRMAFLAFEVGSPSGAAFWWASQGTSESSFGSP